MFGALAFAGHHRLNTGALMGRTTLISPLGKLAKILLG